MLKKIKNLMAALVLPFAFAAPVTLAVAPAYAVAGIGCATTIQKSLNGGANVAATGQDNNCSPTDSSNSLSLQGIASKIVNLLSVVVGIVAVIMIIFGGFKYITSGGESGNVSGAKNTLIYAIVGLIIVALAQFIVHFVLNNIPS